MRIKDTKVQLGIPELNALFPGDNFRVYRTLGKPDVLQIHIENLSEADVRKLASAISACLKVTS